MKSTHRIVAALLVTLLAACSKPLPVERSTYVGEWQGGPISLDIYADGRVVYLHKEGNSTRSIDAPLKEFKGDNFIVGVGFISTEFVVTKPPHEDGGLWKMTVDGVEVTRAPTQLPDVERNEGTST